MYAYMYVYMFVHIFIFLLAAELPEGLAEVSITLLFLFLPLHTSLNPLAILVLQAFYLFFFYYFLFDLNFYLFIIMGYKCNFCYVDIFHCEVRAFIASITGAMCTVPTKKPAIIHPLPLLNPVDSSLSIIPNSASICTHYLAPTYE